jgi:hypothetical protein
MYVSNCICLILCISFCSVHVSVLSSVFYIPSTLDDGILLYEQSLRPAVLASDGTNLGDKGKMDEATHEQLKRRGFRPFATIARSDRHMPYKLLIRYAGLKPRRSK